MHFVNQKTWIVVLQVISCMQFAKEIAGIKINKMHEEGTISYKTRSQILMAMTIFCELTHCFW